MTDRNQGWDLSNRVYTLLVVLGCSLTLFWVFRMVEIWTGLNGGVHEISVDAEGSAYVVPDTAVIRLGVDTDAATSEEAVSTNTTTMNAVMEAIKGLGIEEAKIKTVDYSLYPNYEYDKYGNYVENGYTLSQSVEVRLTDFELIGQLISAGSTAGANSIGGVEFTVDDPEAAKSEARTEAIQQAKEKAQQIADAAGLSLGSMVNYYEYTNTDYYPRYYDMSEAADYATGAAPDIQAGEDEVSLTVTLTYQIR